MDDHGEYERLTAGIAGELTPFGHRIMARVYFADTDFSGVVYHARYLEFFERGRSDFLRLAGVHHTEGHKGAPRLTNAIAQFECEPYACHDGGDHLIFLGRVVNFRTSDTAAEPLLFFRGRYHSVAGPRIDVDAWPLPLHY